MLEMKSTWQASGSVSVGQPLCTVCSCHGAVALIGSGASQYVPVLGRLPLPEP